MGSRYLTDLAEVCRRAGWPVVEVNGWPTRARNSGGYGSGAPNHVMVHHTASGPASDGWPDVNYCTYSDDDAPLCNLYLARDGTIYVCAAGATNTNGSGQDPCGLIGDDTMNANALGVEAGNDGTGEPWPAPQQDAYVALCAALDAAYGIATGQVHAHAEWAPTRKVDPAGPSRWANSGTWPMAGFRDDVASCTPGPAPGPAPPEPEDDDMPRYLVKHPDGSWYVTDMATYRTYVPDPGLGSEGIALFGWDGDGDGPWGLGPGWAPYLDQLPKVCP